MGGEGPAAMRRRCIWILVQRLAVFLLLAAFLWAPPLRAGADLALAAGWLLLMGAMVFRLFPSRLSCLGCQKEFSARLHATGERPRREEIRQADRGALWVLLSWAVLNVPFFIGYVNGWLERRFMVCLSAFYAVCDLVCVLFFCPFQAWMLHNRCCTTCRIYNWDFMMMCTPLLPLTGWMARSACLLAAVLLIRWEAAYRRFPERFFESGNRALSCRQCTERLCRYKRALFPNMFCEGPPADALPVRDSRNPAAPAGGEAQKEGAEPAGAGASRGA